MASGVSDLGFRVRDESEARRTQLVLMGLRCSGKTTLGRLVAAQLAAAFVDLDERTAALLGRESVREAWARGGEGAFRLGESKALSRQIGGPDVLALGGGTPLAPGASDQLRRAQERGDVVLVYLRATPATLRERLRAAENDDRPSLTGAGVPEEIEQVFAIRDELYRELAGVVVEVDGLSEDELVEKLTGLIELA